MLRLASGLELRVQDQGSGPPVLFLHGLGSTLETWALNVPVLAGRMRCLAPDLPGFGESALPPRYFTIEDFAGCMFELLDHIGVGEAAVVGSSMGGLIALEMAASRPDRVSRLALVSPPGMDEDADSRTLLRLLRWIREDGRPRLRTLDEVRLLTPQASTDVMFLANLALERARGFLAGIPAAAGYAPRGRAARVACPTFVVWGAEDGLVPVGAARAWREQVPGAELAILEGAGHAPHFDRPEEFNRRLIEFLLCD